MDTSLSDDSDIIGVCSLLLYMYLINFYVSSKFVIATFDAEYVSSPVNIIICKKVTKLVSRNFQLGMIEVLKEVE